MRWCDWGVTKGGPPQTSQKHPSQTERREVSNLTTYSNMLKQSAGLYTFPTIAGAEESKGQGTETKWQVQQGWGQQHKCLKMQPLKPPTNKSNKKFFFKF